MSRTGAHAQWKTGGASVAQPERLYPVYDAGTKRVEWYNAPPASASLVYDAATGRAETYDEADMPGALSVVRLARTTILSTT